ncbi:ABC transporter substrate-binding protein [Rhodococcoides kyotonense]|uniref:ABC transporter substrate-binding protein n=1 Tax=Rhodococcoides kyotonense TaxID=398843 RepID=UPI001FE84CC1|nr:ABC transporter substrate-binding protein [Rhodococcus kyotonensis]
MPHNRRALSAARASAALITAVIAASCATADTTPVAEQPSETPAFTKIPPTSAVSTCGPGSGATLTDGVLTIATDDPAYSPWFADDDPSNGRGFEGATAREISQRLGYGEDQVRFVRTPFADALAPGPKPFDFDINQFTILGERRENVDLSSPYYAVAQAVVAMADTPAAAATDLAGIRSARIGAQANSTSLQSISATIGAAPTEFDTTDDAKSALQNGDVDAIVVDFPTAFQITSSDVPGSVVVGQFPQPNEVTEFFGVVLEKNSPMTPCVNGAIDSMYADGTADELAQTWLGNITGARVLE